MKQLLSLLFVICITLHLQAQDKAWSIDGLTKNANITQTDDGMILISDKSSLRSVMPTTGAINWEVTDVKDLDELKLMQDYPYLKNTGKYYSIIDSRDGKIISYHEAKTYIESIEELTDQGKLLFNLKSDKADVIELLDLKTNEIWSQKIADKVESNGIFGAYDGHETMISPSGKMVLFRKKAIHIVNMSDGNIVKQIELKKKYSFLAETADKSAFLIQYEKMLQAYSAADGALLWETKNKKRNLDVLLAGKDNNDWLVIDRKEYTIYDAETGSVVSEGKWKKEPEFLYNHENRLFGGIKKELVEFDKATLEVRNSKTFDHNVKSLNEVNGTIIMNTKYANEINLDDFSLTYPYKNDLPLAISDIIDTDDYVLYVNRNLTNIEVNAINNNGEEIWSYGSPSVNAPSIDLLEGGRVLIISDTELAMLNVADGEKVWKKNVTRKPGFAYALNENTNRLGIYNGKRTGYIDLSSGALTMFDQKVKFKDFDATVLSPSIAMLDEGIYLKGSNSIAYYAIDGTQVYNNHYRKSDNTSTLMKLAGAAATMGAVATGNAGKVVTVTNTNTGEVVHKGSMVDGLNDNYAYSEQMAARRQRNANRGSFAIPYVFTKQENGDRGLIFFDMKTGEERYSITMLEKEPKYIMDEYEKMIYYFDSKAKKVVGYSLK